MAESHPNWPHRLFFLDPVTPLLIAALLTPCLAVVAPLGLAPMFVGTAVLSLLLGWRRGAWKTIDPIAAGAIIMLIVWCLLSAAWAQDVRQTLKGSLTILVEAIMGLGLICVASRLDTARSRLLGLALTWGIGLGTLLVTVEIFTPGITPLFIPYPDNPAIAVSQRVSRLSRALTILTLFGVPTCLWIWQRGHKIWAVILALVTIALVFSSHSLASKLALPLAWIIVGLAHSRPRQTVRAVAGGMLLVVVATPLLAFLPPPQTTYDAMSWLPASAHHRLTIWHFTAQRVLERPFLGWAMDGSRTIPGADDEVIVIRHNLGGVPVHEAQLPLHPHNAPLQWWLELGLGGLLAVVTLLGRLIVLASRHQGIAAGAMLAAIGSAFCISSVSYGFWQSWWQGGLWLTAAMLVSLFSCRPANQSSSKAFL